METVGFHACAPQAEALAKQLAGELWDNRERYATKYLTIAEAMDRAASHNQGPLVLADRADNPGSGAPGDSTFVLKALVEREIGPALFGVMWDPMAFQIAEEAGEGARIRMRLGGKSGAVSGDPVDLDVIVKKIARNVFQKVPEKPGLALSRCPRGKPAQQARHRCC